MFDKYIDEFVPSAEMKEYLKGSHRSVDTIAEITYYSPAPVERKKIALMKLLEDLNPEDDQELIENTKAYLASIQEALRLIDAEGVFSIEQCCYNEKIGDSDYYFNGLFNKFDELIQHIKHVDEVCEINDDTPLLYQAVKWINDSSGKLVEACTYWIVRGEIWLVQVEGRMLDEDSAEIYALDDLNLAVPFKAGDIVEIDLYPFADKRIIEIVEVGDNHDCCCLQALSRRKDGSWTIGAVKHGHIGDNLILGISPLYTMTAYKGVLPPEYEVLTKVRDFIDGKEENGAILWMALSPNRDITEEKILEFIANNEENEV